MPVCGTALTTGQGRPLSTITGVGSTEAVVCFERFRFVGVIYYVY